MDGPRLATIVWAVKDLRRQPGTALLTGLAIAALVAAAGTVLLLVEAWSATATTLLESGPSLVVRRVEPAGWRPLPAEDAVRHALGVVGVTSARPRIWGVVRGPAGPVTVQGVDERMARALTAAGVPVPHPGQAVSGPGLALPPDVTTLALAGTIEHSFEVAALLDDALALAVHDVVLLHVDDARALLGLDPHEASDLAVDVYHESEEQAILPDLAAAFPWPVSITPRSEAIGAAVATLARRGGLAMTLLVPALLAMVLLVGTALRANAGSRREIGLHKALGWTTGDLVRLQLFKSLAVGIPAVLVGLAVAWWLVFRPGITWPGALLLGWTTSPPPLTLAPGGAVVTALTVGATVLAPWLLASILPALRSATADPDDLVRGGG